MPVTLILVAWFHPKRYIAKLTLEYQTLQAECAQLSSRCNDLAARQQLLAQRSGEEVMTQALVEVEALAAQIVNEAKAEAAAICNNTREELWQMQNQKRFLSAEINGVIDRLRQAVPQY